MAVEVEAVETDRAASIPHDLLTSLLQSKMPNSTLVRAAGKLWRRQCEVFPWGDHFPHRVWHIKTAKVPSCKDVLQRGTLWFSLSQSCNNGLLGYQLATKPSYKCYATPVLKYGHLKCCGTVSLVHAPRAQV
uniref:Uncharacterized protein n=1 Tax=Eutreptiella gymnastica TaxID=73025 RepID=A0A7S4GDJ8_9EUGL|eukprot:CAMPEP_0174386610 /NCGR_PEP_ID=MMETSP0811_2-20130205/127396_1 /TAXON_ID=73025 ORGANISM="Eutreptiella gymnastica-like, Strain CCMP1594" /NCGR_SAMPLE_ID=MMETSP0811_2 /ASSEMBLY_ACC=CAM_ASM_000667 /LENGTH=131 /DNA_ID=CAMNT_0015541345 /DNA_START=215 /DNA_END=610 /DNA_ORIENTATION=-